MPDNTIPVTPSPRSVYIDIPGGYPLRVSLGKNIRRLRRAAELTQDQLGDILGVGQPAVSKWERDEAQPSASDLPRLAIAIRSRTDAILQGLSDEYDATSDLTR